MINNTIKPKKPRNKKEKKRYTIPSRIESIKKMLNNKNLDPLVDFNRCDTEYFTGQSNDDYIGDVTNISNLSYDSNMSKCSKCNKSDGSCSHCNNARFRQCNSDDGSNNSNDTRHFLKKKAHDFYNIIKQIGGKLFYIKSGTTGHTFRGLVQIRKGLFKSYAVKVVAYPKRKRYGTLYNIKRPENAELLMIRTLSYFVIKGQTPHIVLPIGTFDTNITHFTNLIRDGIVSKDNKKYNDFIKKYKKKQLHSKVSILISEWANRGDLLDFIRNSYKSFKPITWKVFFFQFISVLAVIQTKFPAFRHNDLKANNVLVHKINVDEATRFRYRINNKKYVVPSIGYQIKLWDFDFACIPGIVDNLKVNAEWAAQEINVRPIQNRYYDMHYFFNTLIKRGFFPEFMTEDCIPQEAKDFVNRIVPPVFQSGKYVTERGRILVNTEYKIPDEVIKTDEYFEEFRRAAKKYKNKGPKNLRNSKNANSRKKSKRKSKQNSEESHKKYYLKG